MKIDRRQLLSCGAAAAATNIVGGVEVARASTRTSQAPSRTVSLAFDAANIGPAEYVDTLQAMVAGRDEVADSYSQGGVVAELEAAFATLLGKEDCVFLPTGVLANHLAMRTLAADAPRALCLHDSHIFRDENDSLATLGELAVIPFPEGRIAPSAQDLAHAYDDALNGPRPVRVGAIALESPVRRLDGQMIALEDVERIAAEARRHGTRLHLDGARLLLAPPGFDFRAYVAPFDTVYVSLYKYLGAPFGAVLLGDKDVIDRVRAQKVAYGSTIYQSLVSALPALETLKTFRPRYEKAWARGEQLLRAIQSLGFTLKPPLGPHPSNVHHVLMSEEQAKAVGERAAERGIVIRRWQNGALPIQVNTSILNRPLDAIAEIFAI